MQLKYQSPFFESSILIFQKSDPPCCAMRMLSNSLIGTVWTIESVTSFFSLDALQKSGSPRFYQLG